METETPGTLTKAARFAFLFERLSLNKIQDSSPTCILPLEKKKKKRHNNEHLKSAVH